MRKTLIPLLVLLAIAVAWVAFQPTESTDNLDELTLFQQITGQLPLTAEW